MIEASLSEVLVLGYVREMIEDRRTNEKNPWHRLDVRDEASGAQMYVSLTDPEGKRLSDTDRKAAAELLEVAQGLAMGDRVKLTVELHPELTARGGQLVKFRLRSVEELPARLGDKPVPKAA